MTKKSLSPLLILAEAVCFSLGGVIVKSIPWGSMAINGARSLIAGLVILLYMKLRRHKLVFNRSVLLGGAMMCATSALYVYANKLTTAASAIILQYTAPVFIIIYMWAVFHKKPDRWDIAAIPVIACGVVCFFLDSLLGGSGTMSGNLLALASGATFAVVFMMKVLPGSDNLSSVFTGCVLGAVIGMPFVTCETDFSPAVLGAVLALSVFQFACAYICMAEGLEHTPPLTASLISTIEPILNPILAAVVIGEKLGPTALVGAAIVVAGILAYNILKARFPAKPPEVTHE
ncbi:MAG: EamA family transporter [Clostridia bacterium]|nr:EamA family transporter [Clostridia bacterium]